MNRRYACWILRQEVEGLRLVGGAAAVHANKHNATDATHDYNAASRPPPPPHWLFSHVSFIAHKHQTTHQER